MWGAALKMKQKLMCLFTHRERNGSSVSLSFTLSPS
uniref:Uncharacterized protein n=1 Tax=Anguilla anguilla TaxID=7936 RepID=A0A0E9T0K8_ANGAN